MTNGSLEATDDLDHVTLSALTSQDTTELYGVSESVTMHYGDPAPDIQIPILSSEYLCDMHRDTDCFSSCEPSRLRVASVFFPLSSVSLFSSISFV